MRALSHPNGWVRDTAQRLLVERNSGAAVPLLKQLATGGREPLGRLHALWTLEGTGQLDATTVLAAIEKEQHPKVLAAAFRVSEPLMKGDSQAQLLPKLASFATDQRVDVRVQLALTLGQIVDPVAEAAMAQIALVSGTNALIRDALISGLVGREDEMIARVTADPAWAKKQPGWIHSSPASPNASPCARRARTRRACLRPSRDVARRRGRWARRCPAWR